MADTQQLLDIAKLKPGGTYARTDLSLYSELSAANVKAAIVSKDPATLQAVFRLISTKDSRVGSELERREEFLSGRTCNTDLNAKHKKSVREVLSASLQAKLFGYAVLEYYIKPNGEIAISHIEDKYLSYQNDKVWLTGKNGKEFEAKAPKYLLIKRKPQLLKLVWIVYAKHFVLSHYLKFTEFLAVPPIIVQMSDSSSDAIELVRDGMRTLKSGSFGVLGKDDVIELLEGRGSQADFLNFVSYCDREIAIGLNGSSLTSEAKGGSYAMSKTHEDARYDLLASDCRNGEELVDEAFEPLGLAANSQVLYERDKDLKTRAEVMEIAQRMGYATTPENIAKELDLPEAANNVTAQGSDTDAQGTEDNSITLSRLRFSAENNSQIPSDAIDSFDPPPELEEEIETTLGKILEASATYEDAYEALIRAYPETDMELLEDTLVKAIANASTLGRVDL